MQPGKRIISTALLLTLSAFSRGAAETAPNIPLSAPQQNTGPAPTIQVFSRETIVDVTVTDDQGKPVRGLNKADFTVEEDGKPQPIRSFGEFGAEPPQPANSMRTLPSGVYTNFQAAPVNGPINIILLDAFHSNFQFIAFEKEAILTYLQTSPTDTPTAIFWLSVSGLHLLQGLTTDRAALIRAMTPVRADIGNNISAWTRQWYTIDAFQQISQYVSGIKGRKNLLWFTPGMPIMLTRDGGYSWHDSDTGRVHRLMDTYEMLTAEEVALYPISPVGPAPLGMQQLKAEEVAEGTGGLALYNNNDIAGLLSKAIDHGAHFYTISYVPRTTEDRRYHSIKIEVARPGLHLVYRKGYTAEDPPVHPLQPGAATMKAAMEGTAPPATQLLFDVQAIQTPISLASSHPAAATVSARRSVAAKPAFPFDFLFMVPQSQIAFTQTADGNRSGSIEFDVAAYADDRKMVGLISQTVKLPLTPDQYKNFLSKPMRFTQHLDLPPGNFTVRVGILDSVSNKVGTLEFPLIVGPGGSSIGVADTPNPIPCPPRCVLPVPPAPAQ